MADRTLVVSLRAEAAQFRTAMNDAAGAADRAGAAAEGAGRKVQSSAQQVEAASQKVSNARRSEQDAAARLHTAETKLDEVKKNSKATASQVVQAEERVLTSRNRLEKATETLESAEKSHSLAMQTAAQNAGQSQSKFQKFTNQIEQNSQAWTTAGTALTVMGGAIIGAGVAAGKSGVEFNNLKQISGAAMKTLTGSTAEANAQMDKLNEFGSNSWIMRDVLLRAQQQMVGFGISTEKVIPYMDGLAEAVAATGGSSQQFEELAFVMSKVQSRGKLTANTFNEFGMRGVDAATIIGEQMGQTADEIRDGVTKGTLDAEEALDALAEGMKEKYAGASDNVRNTFRGSMDDVMAAWRDLSSAMTAPLVDPDGGGLAVAGLNALSDGLVKVKNVAEEMPTPVKLTALGIGGLAGATSLAAGGFLLMAPRIVETQKAFKALAGQDDLVGSVARGLGKLKGPMLAIAKSGATAAVLGSITVALAKFVEDNKLDKAQQGTKSVANALEDLKSSADGLDRVFQLRGGDALTGDIDSLGDALDRTFNRDWEQKFSDWGESFIQKLTPLRGHSGMIADGFSAIDTELANLVEGGKADEAAAAFEQIRLQAEEQDVSLERLKILFPEYADAVEAAGDAATEAAGGIGKLSPEAVAASEHLDEVKEQLTESAQGFLDFAEKATDAKVSLQEWIDDMAEQVKAQETWFDNLESLMHRGAPQEFIDFLMSLGPEGAKRVKQLADASDTELQRAIDKFTEGKDAAGDFAGEVLKIPDVDLDADASKLKGQVKTAKERLDELRKLPTTPEIDAQITLLEEKVKDGRAKLKELEEDKTTAEVDADTQPAKDEVGGFKKWFKDHSSVTLSVWAKVKETFEKTDSSGPTGAGKAARKYRERKDGYYGHVLEAYADGGLRPMGPIAQMVQPNTWRVVGDRMDVDEAYIPLDGSKRSRSILMQAISRMPNLTAMASGGVVSAQRRLDAAQHALDSINKSSRKVTAEDRRRDAAQKRVDDARAALDKAKEAEAKRERITSLQSDLRQDVRRGNLRDQITRSLSGGYSAVDRLFNLGDNEDLSRGSRSKATSAARKFEANLKSLYKQADRIDEKLKDAQDKASELQSISDSVSSGLLNDRGVDVGDYQNFANGQWTTHSGVAGATRRLTADVGAMKSFAGKLKKLASKGIPGAIIQEIAQAGVAEGSTMADAFLDASDTEVQSYVGAWNEYEKYANQAGQYVTEGFYEGGLNAANGVVKGLESQQQNVEKAIANLAKTMEATFKSVLGIHSPSRVMSELGGFTAEGLVQGMLGGVTDVQSAAAALGAAAVPAMGDMNMDVGVNPVVADDEFTAGLAMQDMSATTLEAMELMRQAVASGWENMLFTTQESQAGMLEGTQVNQSGMLTALQAAQLGMLTDTRAKQAGMLTETQVRQAAMLVSTQTQQEAMRQTVSQKQTDSRTKLTAEQELMRATTAQKQAATRDSLTSQQEAMRLVMADKQSRMRSQNATDFESIRSTTHSKLTSMRSSTDSTMTGLHGDYSARMASLKNVNRTGFESILDAANSNMRGVREGVDRQMAAARPELGGRMNDLINVLTKFTASVNKAFGDVGVKLDAPQKLAFATGGVMPGYTPGRDVHQFRSPTAGELYLSGGEAIMRPEWTRAMGGEAGVKAQNEAARQGRLDDLLHAQSQAFATGGVFGPVPGVNAFADAGVWRNLWAITRDQFPNARLTSAYRGGSRTVSGNASYHSRGMAIDVSPSMDIFNFWRNKYGANLAELIYSPANGKQIKNGNNHYYTGAVRGMHFNHVHIAARQALSDAMAGGLPGMGGAMSHPFLDRAGVSAGSNLQAAYAKAAKKLTAQIYAKHSKDLPDGIAGQLGKGIMSQVSEGLIGKAKEYGKTTAISGATAGDPAVKAAVRKVAEQMGWDKYWGDIDWLVNKESTWNPNAANPSSSARGLFQKMTSLHGPVEDTVEGQARWGLNYIKSTYGNPAKARAFHQSHNWYEGGTERAKSGLAVVGEKGPELVNFRGGEQVMSTTDSMRFMAANRTYIPAQTTGAGIDYDRLGKAIADSIPPSLVQQIDSSSLDAKRIGKAAVQEWTDKQNLYAMGARV